MPKLAFEDVGPVRVVYDYGVESGQLNLDLKPYHGAFRFADEDRVVDVFEEEYGEDPVDAVVMGSVAILEIPLTRIEWSKLNSVLPGTSISVGGAGGGGDIITFKSLVGYSMYDSAVPILLRPIVNNAPTTDRDKWILIYKCHAHKAFDLSFTKGDQRVLLVRFKVFPNQTSGYEGEKYQFGAA